jgi:hypothetical protein
MLLSPELLRTLDAPTKAIVLVEVRMSRRVSSAFRNDMLLNANVRERFQSIRDRASIPSAIESLQILVQRGIEGTRCKYTLQDTRWMKDMIFDVSEK